MECPTCGTQNRDIARFCQTCGAPLETKKRLPTQDEPTAETSATLAEQMSQTLQSRDPGTGGTEHEIVDHTTAPDAVSEAPTAAQQGIDPVLGGVEIEPLSVELENEPRCASNGNDPSKEGDVFSAPDASRGAHSTPN